MPDHWTVIRFVGPEPFGTYYVALVDHQGNYVRRHPIPFPYEREADRAAARLNARDFGAAGEPVPVVPEDEARAKRQARIAELRAQMQKDHADG